MHRKNQGSPFLAEFIRNCTPFGIDPPRPTKSCVLYKYKKHCTYSFIHSDPCSSRTEMDAAKDQPQTVMQPSRHLSILRSGCGEKPSHLTQQMDVLNCQESHSQQRKSCLSRRLRIKRASFLFRNFPSNNRDRQQIPELNFTCPLSLTGRLSQRFLAARRIQVPCATSMHFSLTPLCPNSCNQAFRSCNPFCFVR